MKLRSMFEMQVMTHMQGLISHEPGTVFFISGECEDGNRACVSQSGKIRL